MTRRLILPALVCLAATAGAAEPKLLSQGLPADAYTSDRKPVNEKAGADKAFDGKWQGGDTAWVEGPQFPAWIMVDLGKPCHVIKANTFFERPWIWISYKIEVSADKETWTMFSDQSENKEPSEDPAYTDMGMVDGRYVRITMTNVPDPKDWYWPVIKEFQVYGLPVDEEKPKDEKGAGDKKGEDKKAEKKPDDKKAEKK